MAFGTPNTLSVRRQRLGDLSIVLGTFGNGPDGAVDVHWDIFLAAQARARCVRTTICPWSGIEIGSLVDCRS